jgi:hypothetical protein
VVACTKTAASPSSLFVTAVSGCVYTIPSHDGANNADGAQQENTAYARHPGGLNYSTAVGLPALRFGLGSIASNMMIGK